MKKLLLYSLIVSCLVYNNVSQAQNYVSTHTIGKLPIILEAKGAGIVDLTSLIKSNPHLVFAVKDSKTGKISYTRNGIFYNKNDGYYYQDQKRLQGYPVSTDITSTDCQLTDIKSPPEEIPALPTTTIEYMGNLNATAVIPSTQFSVSDPSSYNFQVQNSIYDSLGSLHQLVVYYIKHSANCWTVLVYVDSINIGSGNLSFSTSGALVSATGLSFLSFVPTTGAQAPQYISLRFTAFTQYAASYSANVLSDGMPVGIYSSFMVDDNGYISFNYSNAQTITFSKIAVFIQE